MHKRAKGTGLGAHSRDGTEPALGWEARRWVDTSGEQPSGLMTHGSQRC